MLATSLPTEYLAMGLTGLARAGTVESLFPNGNRALGNGHPPAAVISAYSFSRENRLDPAALQHVRAQADLIVAQTPELFVSFEPEPARPELVVGLAEVIGRCIAARNAHGVIYGAHALRALRELPELATPPVVGGVALMLECWTGRPDHWAAPNPQLAHFYGPLGPLDLSEVRVEPGDAEPETEREMVVAALAELDSLYESVPAPGAERARYQGTGIKAHTVTLTHALCELETLGYGELVGWGVGLQRLLIKQGRVTPPEVAGHAITETPYASALDAAYWAAPKRPELHRPSAPHAIKFPHAAQNLLNRLDVAERARYEPGVCRLLTTYLQPV